MNPELSIALGSAVIALAALGATIWQGFLTRRHNRLSVTPLLKLDRVVAHNKEIAVILKNTGVGPAIIQTYDIKVDGNLIQGRGIARMRAALDSLGLENYSFEIYTPFSDEALAVGESTTLFISSPNSTDGERKQIRAVVPRIQFIIRYKSIYGDESLLTG